jgi:hypothetical protein
MSSTVISFPVPAYANVPIEPQFYQPNFFFISAIMLGFTTIVTTTVNHNYVVGQQVRLVIPSPFGTYQLNEKSALVIAIPALNQVTLAIDSTNFDQFIASSASTQPQIMAIGDVNSGAINANGNLNLNLSIPGSFTNISPL